MPTEPQFFALTAVWVEAVALAWAVNRDTVIRRHVKIQRMLAPYRHRVRRSTRRFRIRCPQMTTKSPRSPGTLPDYEWLGGWVGLRLIPPVERHRAGSTYCDEGGAAVADLAVD